MLPPCSQGSRKRRCAVRSPAAPGPRLLVGPYLTAPRSPPGAAPPWAYFPPTGSTAYLRVFRKDVHVVRCHPEAPPEARVPAPRAAIWEFSRKSRARLRHLCRNGGHVVRSQYLLTYHNQSPIDGRAVKRDLDRWLKAARRILGSDLAYLWALEFQVRRGFPTSTSF